MKNIKIITFGDNIVLPQITNLNCGLCSYDCFKCNKISISNYQQKKKPKRPILRTRLNIKIK